MKLFIVVTEATTISGVLENLRKHRVDRALEALEQQLDTVTVMLNTLTKELEQPADRERAVQTLRLIRNYRQFHPRQAETDMSKFEQTLVEEARNLRERARRILEEIK